MASLAIGALGNFAHESKLEALQGHPGQMRIASAGMGTPRVVSVPGG